MPALLNKKLAISLVLLGALLSLGDNKAYAEFSCKAEVSYKWKKAKAENETEVYFSSVERKGLDEAKAKAALSDALAKEKVLAFETCKKEHEDLASCISAKYTSFNSTLQALTFSARKALEEAITSDCGGQVGSCSSSTATDAKCEEVVVSAPESAGKDSAGKDAAKGKEKKK